MKINIKETLEQLKIDKSSRTQKNLVKLSNILESYGDSGQRDFSITQIGRVSSSSGGPGYEAIRATRNKHYRTLIEAWASYYQTNTKKPVKPSSRSVVIPSDNKLLERITDPAVRALFGQIITERNRYRNEVNILKQNTNIVIDKRVVRPHQFSFDNAAIEYIQQINLTPSEIQALFYAVSEECLSNNDWVSTNAGQVKEAQYNTEVFPRGFITGLRKILRSF